jgi:hypothetical protein
VSVSRTPLDTRSTGATGSLPNLAVIGGMKCGTTSLHRYLDEHPDVAMAPGKELNFFFRDPGGRGRPAAGNWHHGPDWYAARFDAAAPVRGEASPGYTSPDHPEVAARMAALVPDARLVLLVRDPLERAVSQYLHHRRDGAEPRPLDEALLDPDSQYVSRGRYHERLQPFLDHYGTGRIAVVEHRDLLADRRATLAHLFRFVGVDPDYWSDAFRARWNTARHDRPDVAPRVRAAFAAAVADDVARLRELTGRSFAHWVA